MRYRETIQNVVNQMIVNIFDMKGAFEPSDPARGQVEIQGDDSERC